MKYYFIKKSKTFIAIIIALTVSNNLFSQLKFQIDNQEILKKISAKPKKVKVVIDTDTYNEIDDQFALVYALLSPEAMDVQAIYAAPFKNKRAPDEGLGMQKSYDEIMNVLDRMKHSKKDFVYKGSDHFMKDIKEPVVSEAAKDLVARAMAATETLYVLALGAPTNVASALIMEPKIKDKIVVIWLGGKGLNWKNANEYNLFQDMVSSKIMFDSGVPLIQIPTEPVSSHLITTTAELKEYIGGKNKISDYLIDIFKDYGKADPYGWSKVIWDIAVIAYVVNADWLPTELRPTPILTDQKTYSIDNTRHLYKVVTFVNRNKVFQDMFKKFAALKD